MLVSHITGLGSGFISQADGCMFYAGQRFISVMWITPINCHSAKVHSTFELRLADYWLLHHGIASNGAMMRNGEFKVM